MSTATRAECYAMYAHTKVHTHAYASDGTELLDYAALNDTSLGNWQVYTRTYDLGMIMKHGCAVPKRSGWGRREKRPSKVGTQLKRVENGSGDNFYRKEIG